MTSQNRKQVAVDARAFHNLQVRADWWGVGVQEAMVDAIKLWLARDDPQRDLEAFERTDAVRRTYRTTGPYGRDSEELAQEAERLREAFEELTTHSPPPEPGEDFVRANVPTETHSLLKEKAKALDRTLKDCATEAAKLWTALRSKVDGEDSLDAREMLEEYLPVLVEMRRTSRGD